MNSTYIMMKVTVYEYDLLWELEADKWYTELNIIVISII